MYLFTRKTIHYFRWKIIYITLFIDGVIGKLFDEKYLKALCMLIVN